MPPTSQILSTARALRDQFEALGGQVVKADVLQPADELLDLYGEDIRARAYLTSDPLHGEMVLRPDFTVPVVQMHMETFAEPARYTYAGKVFRKQETDTTRANEYVQVGYEVFDGKDPSGADAEVFAAISGALFSTTSTSKLMLSTASRMSVALTVTWCTPACADEGDQDIWPLFWSMNMPDGFCSRV